MSSDRALHESYTQPYHQSKSSSPNPPHHSKRLNNKYSVNFCKIGGLDQHLKTLREMIIFPLMHANVYSHFDIKAPRGVLFYGPPGTGKTLVASALATEINKESAVNVNFFYQKCSDILDKWFGESEKKLTEIFQKANECRPSIIFFDEIDGLAPCRSTHPEQVHNTIVTTLLSLMDGLECNSGLVVIGATNRIDALDPALRRPGRFDKELYFPLPGAEARRAILEVYMQSWKTRPTENILKNLIGATSGFSGADLSALCSEAIFKCIKRVYPCMNNKKIDIKKLELKECDFINAKIDQVSTAIKTGRRMRKLSPIIRPLLQQQLNRILDAIHTFWPHFFKENFKYRIGEERYAGRVLLIGNSLQGLNLHLIPAILERFEYLPVIIYDINTTSKIDTIKNIKYPFPKLILLFKIDEWWNTIEESNQKFIISSLEQIHAELPVLVIGSCNNELPTVLQNIFYNNSNIRMNIENPTNEEKAEFLKPLFFNRHLISLVSVLEHSRRNANVNRKRQRDRSLSNCRKRQPFTTTTSTSASSSMKKRRMNSATTTSSAMRQNNNPSAAKVTLNANSSSSINSTNSNSNDHKGYFPVTFSNLLHAIKSSNQNDNNSAITSAHDCRSISDLKESLFNEYINHGNHSGGGGGGVLDDGSNHRNAINDVKMEEIRNLWLHASSVTSATMNVSQLELFYDVISACIDIYWNNFDSLLRNLSNVLETVEKSLPEITSN